MGLKVDIAEVVCSFSYLYVFLLVLPTLVICWLTLHAVDWFLLLLLIIAAVLVCSSADLCTGCFNCIVLNKVAVILLYDSVLRLFHSGDQNGIGHTWRYSPTFLLERVDFSSPPLPPLLPTPHPHFSLPLLPFLITNPHPGSLICICFIFSFTEHIFYLNSRVCKQHVRLDFLRSL